MSSPIVQPSAFNAAKITVSQPKALEAGGKMAYMGYGESRNLVLQTPSLQVPYGVKNSAEGEYARPGPPKYSVDLALRGYQDAGKVKAFHDALAALDEHMIKLAEQNTKLWFGKVLSREVIAAFYTPSLKFGRTKEGDPSPYPPTVKVQLKKKYNTDDFECNFYDQSSKTDPNAKPLVGIPIEELLPKRSEVTALIQPGSVWFVNGKFGVSWKATQVRLDVTPEGAGAGYAFVDDEDDVPVRAAGRANTGGGSSRFTEPAEFSPAQQGSTRHSAPQSGEFSAPARAAAPAPAAAANPAFEEDDDDEVPAPAAVQRQIVEEDDDEVAPPPVPKKATVTKKTVQTKLVTKAK
jgi:hypothetical protein